MSITILLSVIFGGLLAVAMAIVAVVVSRPRMDTTLPRCGKCGYNLTGAPSNRCPECGKLFIEAGVITRQPGPVPSRRMIWVLMLVLVGFTVLGVLGAIVMRMQAVASQQAAFQAQMLAPVTPQRATTTAPSTEDGPAGQSREAP